MGKAGAAIAYHGFFIRRTRITGGQRPVGSAKSCTVSVLRASPEYGFIVYIESRSKAARPGSSAGSVFTGQLGCIFWGIFLAQKGVSPWGQAG